MSKLMLFSNCFPVKGYKRSVICDVSRFKYDFIPNSLYDLLIYYNGKDVSEIKSQLSNSEIEVFESYMKFLLENEYIFFTDHPELFPSVEMNWESPALINNAIIDFDKSSQHDLLKIIKELNDLRCEAIEIRTFDPISILELYKIIDCIKDSGFRSVQLLLCCHTDYTQELLKQILSANARIMAIIIHTTPEGVLLQSKAGNSNIFYIKNQLLSEEHCGAVSKFNFTVNLTLFMESHFHNNCLNKKIAVDKVGFIKNCPSMKNHYGHHKSNTLKSALENHSFNKYWDVSKDFVSICKDCEFRYVCTDCRVYTEDPTVEHAKPAKCNYDPYTATWLDREKIN